MDWNANEKELYEKSRALKMQARELRKARLAREDARRERLAREARAKEVKEEEEERKRSKSDQDDRIRKCLLKFADELKANGLAVKAPAWMVGGYMDAMTLVDKKIGGEIVIRTMWDGFNWD